MDHWGTRGVERGQYLKEQIGNPTQTECPLLAKSGIAGSRFHNGRKLAVGQTFDGLCRSLTQTGYTLSRSCLLALLTLSTRHDSGRIGSSIRWGGEMITSLEKLEQQQREREAMRQAIAAYTGPITKCPPGRAGKDSQVVARRRAQEKARIRNSENTPPERLAHQLCDPPRVGHILPLRASVIVQCRMKETPTGLP
jgi:hypothetical protein